MKLYFKAQIAICIFFVFYSCSKDCSWEYDVLHEKWIYKCTHPTTQPQPVVYNLINGSYKVQSISQEILPSLKTSPNYEEIVNRYFLGFKVNIEEIYIEKTGYNGANVFGLPGANVRNASLTSTSISFGGVTSTYRMPDNIFVGICYEGLTMSGTINISNGKPYNGIIEYRCNSELVMRYSFTIKQ
jgi:hypothetical protein